MTASHIQLLPVGPVKLIGSQLPPQPPQENSNLTMGVSNRVFHSFMRNNGNGALNSSNGFGGAKRNLFGSPEPGEIKRKFYDEQNLNRERFISNYGYDIFTSRFINATEDEVEVTATGRSQNEDEHNLINECNKSDNDNAHTALYSTIDNSPVKDDDDCCQHENLLEIEMRAHLSHLAEAESNDCNKNNSESQCDVKCNLNKTNSILDTKLTNLKDSRKCKTDRPKPYQKQGLISDCFTIRKSVVHTSTITSLPKPQRAKLIQFQIEEQQRHHQQQAQQQHHPHRNDKVDQL